jgi:hypothetical protein
MGIEQLGVDNLFNGVPKDNLRTAEFQGFGQLTTRDNVRL